MLRIAGGLICLDIMVKYFNKIKICIHRPTIQGADALHPLWSVIPPWCLSSEGHYTVDVFHLNGNSNGSRETWLHIDDEIVSAVQHDVFGIFNDQRAENRGLYCRTS